MNAAMDWNAAIEKNREALKRILAALVAMAGIADGRAGTLPRHLHRAVLRLLRPAEAATRRLVIVAARGIVVSPPPPRSAWSPAAQGRINGDASTTWFLPLLSLSKGRGRGTAEGGGGGTAMRPMTLPLLDPLRLPRRRRPVASGVPRISVPGYSAPFSLPPPPSPDDPVNAARLGLRLAALATALDDLPAHARRFARWRARGADAVGAQNRDAAGAQNAQNRESRNLRHPRPRRLWPLRPGRPPGWRRRPGHEVDEVLNNAHGLAFWALQHPDTS
jgi:hypothetical protein